MSISQISHNMLLVDHGDKGCIYDVNTLDFMRMLDTQNQMVRCSIAVNNLLICCLDNGVINVYDISEDLSRV